MVLDDFLLWLKRKNPQAVLDAVKSPEAAQALKPEQREIYLKALTEVYGPKEVRQSSMGFDPKTYYHGTNESFNEFSGEKLGSSTGANSARKAHFATDNPDVASEYSDRLLSGEASDLFNKALIRKKEEVWGPKRETFKWLNSIIWDEPDYLKKDVIKIGKNGEHSFNVIDLDKLDLVRNIAKELKQIEENNIRNQIDNFIDSWDGNMGQVYPLKIRKGEVASRDFGGKTYKDYSYSKLIDENPQADTIEFKNTNDSPTGDVSDPHDVLAVKDPARIRSEFAAFDPRFKDSKNILAGVAAAPMVSMDPLEHIGAWFTAYDEVKNKFADKLTERTSFVQPDETLKAMGRMAFDPMNLVDGPLAIGLVAADLASNKKQDKKTSNWFDNKIEGGE